MQNWQAGRQTGRQAVRQSGSRAVGQMGSRADMRWRDFLNRASLILHRLALRVTTTTTKYVCLHFNHPIFSLTYTRKSWIRTLNFARIKIWWVNYFSKTVFLKVYKCGKVSSFCICNMKWNIRQTANLICNLVRFFSCLCLKTPFSITKQNKLFRNRLFIIDRLEA